MTLIILGLDGMNLPLLKHCSQEFSNLQKVLKCSAQGTVTSVVPPLSGPAWNTILTGVGVGSHGYLNTFNFDKERKVNIIEPDKVKLPHFYETIWRSGGRVFIMDVPFSSSRSITGDFLDSYLSTKPQEQAIVPPTLVQRFPSIVHYVNYKGKSQHASIPEYIASFNETIQANGAIIQEVLKARQHDLMFFQLTIVDWVLHKASADLIQGKKTPTSEAARNVFRNLDQLIGKMLSLMNKEDHFVLFSDHGGSVLQGTFFINTWLAQNGYVQLRKAENNQDGIVQDTQNKIIRQLALLARRNQKLRRIGRLVHRKFRSTIDKEIQKDRIDYATSKAFAPIKNIPLITLPSGEDKQKIKEEIITKINQDLGLQAYDTAKYYNCQTPEAKAHIYSFGDIIIDTANFEIDTSLGPKSMVPGDVMFHDLNAFFSACGPSITPGPLSDARLVDIAPTLLALYGIQPEIAMEGKILPIFGNNKPTLRLLEGINI